MRRNEGENLYAILGVSSSATQAEIQAAYKRKARELHPDVNKEPDAEDRFKRLGEAYATLRDERKRAKYDARQQPDPKRSRSRSRSWSDLGYEDIRTGTDDLNFDDLLRRAQARRNKSPRDIRLNLTLAQAYTGAAVSVSDPRTGAPLRVNVPPGAKTGDRLKLTEHGWTVRVRVDLGEFKLEGRDVRMTAKATPWEAALGAEITVQAPHARLRLRIPPGTQSHQMLRIRGQGLPPKPGRPGAPGDLYVRVVVAIPRQLTPDERQLWERLATISRFKPRQED